MIIVLVIIVAVAWAAIGALAVLTVLGAAKLARRRSFDEHFAAAAEIIREDASDAADLQEWERQMRTP